METKTNITINDVARIAGVSKRTVSRVINGSPMVGQKTRERIEKIIKEVNFQPDKQARGLASKRSYLLGLIYDNPDALYIDQVQRGTLDVCTELGYELVVHPCNWKAKDFIKNCLNFISRSRVDGVLILPPVSESKELASTLQKAEFPYVRIASADLDDPTNIVISNDRGAMTDIVEHFISLGHKNAGVISGPMEYFSSKERFEGFAEAAKKLGLNVKKSHVLEGKNTYESGLELGSQLLCQKDRPTAVFANNDEMAAGVVRAARDLGIEIPRDVSLVGFDDNIFASRMIPSLTTIKRPVEEMAEIATKKLIQSISPEHKSTKLKSIMEPYLIKRESTNSVKGKSQSND